MKYIILFILSFLLSWAGYAQEIDEANFKVVPPSPEAASLGKYGDIPVNLSSGIPSVSIPVYQIAIGDIQVPISLSYHAGGIKVGEIASKVGLGWSLSAGGAVTRTMRGRPDESGYVVEMLKLQERKANGKLDLLRRDVTSESVDIQNDKNEQMGELHLANFDREADEFYYNFPGGSGKMVLGLDREFHTIPAENWQVTYSGAMAVNVPSSFLLQQTGYGLGSFSIQQLNGISYEFSDVELNMTGYGSGSEEHFNSAWYLTKVSSSVTNRSVNFHYTAGEIINRDPVRVESISSSEPRENSTNPRTLTRNSTTQLSRYIPQHLDSITWDGGKVVFNYTFDRQDLARMPQLNSIEVFDHQSVKIKETVFEYSYFGTGDAIDKNLRLDRVYERFPDGSANPAHEFTYYGQPASRDSRAQDHLGYFNGAFNAHLVPSFRDLQGRVQTGANRAPNFPASLNGTLTKVKYPTGGESVFEYEPHSVTSQRTVTPTTIAASAENGSTIDLDGNPTSCIVCDTTDEILFTTDGVSGNNTLRLTLTNPGNEVEEVSVTLYRKENNVWVQKHRFLQGVNNPSIVYDVLVANSEYRLESKALASGSRAFAIINWDNVTDVPSFQEISGFRIKKITSSSGDNSPDLVKSYRYTETINSAVSSGLSIGGAAISYLPQIENVYYEIPSEIPNALPILARDETMSIGASPTNHLGTTGGSHILYQNVYEFREEISEGLGTVTSTQGYNQYEYTFFTDEPVHSAIYNLGQASSRHWQRGLLKRQASYDSDDKLVQETVNQYSFQDFLKIPSFVYRQAEDYEQVRIAYSVNGNIYDYTFYDHIIGRAFLDSTITRNFGIGYSETQPVETVMDYGYDATTFLPIREGQQRGDGSNLVTTTSYLTNTSFPAGSITTEEGLVTAASTITYDHKYRVTEVARALLEVPQDQAAFEANGEYTPVVEVTYTALGQPKRVRGRDGLYTHYQYGYNGTLQEASIVQTSSSDVYFEGFEEYEGAGILQAKTGKGSYQGAFQINFLAGSNYVISWSELANGQWVRKQQGFTGSATIGGDGIYIDDVAVHENGAFLTVYGYDPLIGMNSSTDPAGLTTRYRYDSRNRLYQVLDQDGNVLQETTYHYSADQN